MRQAIVTRYLPYTNHRSSRVKATCEAGSVTLDWDHHYNVEGNHQRAAEALARKLGWHGDWYGGGMPGSGYCFVNAHGGAYGEMFTVEKSADAA